MLLNYNGNGGKSGVKEMELWQTEQVRLLHIMRNLELPGKQQIANGTNTRRKEHVFYALGHYDQMVYVRSLERPFDYKHCFAIKYPYTGFKENVDLDQVLCLVPLKCFKDPEDDPFEYSKNDLPFLTLSLLSIESYPLESGDKNGESSSVKFEDIVDDVCNKVDEFLKKYQNNKNLHFISQIFYSLNCADICVAIRSDKLYDCYVLERYIRTMKECGLFVSTTTLFFSSLKDDIDANARKEIAKSNSEVRIALRLGSVFNQNDEA